MLGRFEEAETAYLLRRNQLDSKENVACRFFLGLGFCRHSVYAKSRRYFGENLRAIRKDRDASNRFYAYQGVGFYSYFAGRMRKALRCAERSFEAALEAGFLYGRAFAADLKGHALVQTGRVERGIKTLELAEHLANQLGARWLVETTQASQIAYRVHFGMDAKGEQTLRKKIASLSRQDIFTQSALLLELAEELTRQGRLTEAKAALNDCCRIVHGSQNSRHAALLNLRYAYSHFLEGEPHLALNLVRNSMTQIHPEVDRLLELKLRGLELKLVKALGIEVCTVALTEKVTRLTWTVREAIGERILARLRASVSLVTSYGEDPVGDLWDAIHRDPMAAASDVIKSGRFGLLAEILPVSRGGKAIYLDLEPGSITLFDRGNVEHVPESLSRSIRHLLLALQSGTKTKQELIESVWKYEYHPLRHDALIYAAVAKLRKILGARAHWIEAGELGYQLLNDVTLLAKRSEAPVARAPLVVESEESLLSPRQEKILSYLRTNEFIDTATCRKLFDTSEITASRDLAELHRKQAIERVGRGRATKYRSVEMVLDTQHERSLT